MGTIRLVSTAREFVIDVRPGEAIVESFRRSNLPVLATLLLSPEGRFVSLSHVPAADEEVVAYSLRNPDFTCLQPSYGLAPAADPCTELIRPLQDPKHLALVQFSRADGFRFAFESFEAIVSSYCGQSGGAQAGEPAAGKVLQVALSSGGDGRVLAECIRAYRDRHPETRFHCVITAVGFEDEAEHVGNAVKIAERFDLPYEVYGVNDAADLLGMTTDLEQASHNFRNEFPDDEPEVLGTYWVQQVNFGAARAGRRRAILFGFNQEDVIADRIYQLMTQKHLPPFPVRRLDEFDIVAPLSQVPKKLLDSLDLENSLRNYDMRLPSVSYLRSSLYFIAYMIAESFPAIADVLSGKELQGEDPEEIIQWLASQ